MTSQGPQVNGINARQWTSAGYACHLSGGKENAWIEPVYEQREDISAPVKDITDGTTVGFRYLQFGNNTPGSLTILMKAEGKGTVSVRLDEPGGREIAHADTVTGETTVPLSGSVIGRHAVYFRFSLEEGRAEMDRFTFNG